MTAPLFESTITSLPLINKGKVRDIYAVDADKLLIVTTDRLSAFDVILPDPIPRKGEVLQAVANFWFGKLGHIVPNQLTGIDPESVVAESERDQVRGRAVVVKRLKPLPIEAVVRGYVIGSGWKDYQRTGKVSGIDLPDGLRQAEHRDVQAAAVVEVEHRGLVDHGLGERRRGRRARRRPPSTC